MMLKKVLIFLKAIRSFLEWYENEKQKMTMQAIVQKAEEKKKFMDALKLELS